MVSARTSAAILLTMFAAGCAPEPRPLTQLVLVADTDIDDLDTIAFEVRGTEAPDGGQQAASSYTGGPSFLSLVREQGPLGPLTITASGMRAGVALVRRIHIVSFVQDQTRVVPLHLLASCVARACEEDQTCDQTGCRSRELTASELLAWPGRAPRLGEDGEKPDAEALVDGGAPDAADGAGAVPDASGRDASSERDAGTDGTLSSIQRCGGFEVDVQTNPRHCGRCYNACDVRVELCVAGECVIQ